MKILVTGAGGFIGQRLLPELEVAGHEVLAAGRRIVTGVRQFHVVGDLGPHTDWNRALAGVEVVIHLAARVHIMRESEDKPLDEFRRINVAGTLRLAHQAAEAGIKRFVYLSSIKVNGEETPPGKLFSEKDEPMPEDPYGLTKWEAEQGLNVLAQDSGMEVVIIRPPLVYGPGVKGNFAALIKWVAKGLPLPLGAVNSNRRSLIALDNLVDLVVTSVSHPDAAHQVFLAGDGVDLSTTELIQRLARAMGRSARLLPVPQSLLEAGLNALGKGDLARRLCRSLRVDISKARSMLNWIPPVSVDEGLRRTVAPFL